ncbi:MAG: RNA pseudouridine synthase [Oscillospiraceae bacterium]|nr:RNA pseudouridine synthase [Oscillospiraceae bacterium]
MEIIYEDKDIAVLEKPVGMDSEKDVPKALQAQLGGSFYPVHRLDQNVGGVMVYARNQKAAAELSRQIQNGSFQKEYVALVHGTPEETGDWTDLLFKDSRKNKVFVVKKERTGVKKARLTYQRLTAGEQSLVRIRLYTGRSHQIRVQFASRGYPLVGDHKYGSKAKETAPMLYSCGLQFDLKGQKHFEKLPDWAEG